MVVGFSLDGLLKVRFGTLYLHLSIIVTALGIIYCTLSTRFHFITAASRRLTRDRPICLYTLLMCCHVLLAADLRTYAFEMLPWIIFICLYLYVTYKPADWDALSRLALWTVIIGGFIQYLLARSMGIQIAVREREYVYAGEFGLRMRGMFLEPNYFGLVLLSWLYVYVSSKRRYRGSDIVLLGLTVLALFLSDNRMILLVGALLFSFRGINGIMLEVRRWLPISITSLFSIAYWYGSVHFRQISDRSAHARLGTSANVIFFWLNSDWYHRTVGYGFSNWGAFSNQLGFSVENRQLSWSLTHRDAADVFVFLFEMGLTSLVLAAYDIIFVSAKAKKVPDALFVAAIYLIAFVYPLYQFIYYLIPFMVVRERILGGSLQCPEESEKGTSAVKRSLPSLQFMSSNET